MKYIHFTFGNGYCGCDNDEWQEFEDDITSDELNEIAAEMANENADEFTYVHTGWGNGFKDDDDMQSYYNEVWYDWEEVSEEEYEENK